MNKTCMSAIIALSALSGSAATYYLDAGTSPGSSGETAFRDASYWIDSDGNKSGESGAALDPTADYVMNCALRQSRSGDDAVFGGKSLRIGDGSGPKPHFMQYRNEGTEFGKLYLTSGYYVGNRGHDMDYILTADILVDSASGESFNMALSYTNATMDIRGKLSSTEDSMLSFVTTNPVYSVKSQAKYGAAADDSWNTFILNADISGFKGTLRLGRTTDSRFTATPDNWQIKALIPGTSTLPGKLIVPSYDILSLAGSTVFTVKELVLDEGSMLQLEMRENSIASVVVSDALDFSGPVTVHITGNVMPAAGGKFTLLSAPDTGEGAFTAEDFDLVTDSWGPPPVLSVETDEATNTRKLVLTATRWLPDDVVTMEISDAYTKDVKPSVPKSYDSALTNATQWSSRSVPDGEHDYFVGYTNITDSSLHLRTRLDLAEDTFAGRSLTIGRNCNLLVMTESMTFGDLRLLDGAVLSCPNSGTATVRGAMHLPWGSVRMRQYVSRILHIASTVTGGAEIALEGWNATSSPNGYYSFKNADMSAFTGSIRVTEHPEMPVPDYVKTNQTLMVSSHAGESQLGGKLESFNPKALILERCGTLTMHEGNTLTVTTNNNRGIYINGDGRFRVQSLWHTLDIGTKLTVNGTLVKDGEGSLVLRGECATEGDTAVLDIWTNDVVAASSAALNGLTVKIGEGARLEIRMNPEDEAFLRYGVRMENSETPFVLKDGLDRIPLGLDCSLMEHPEGAVEIGICTVSADAADEVSAMLPAIPSPFPRMSVMTGSRVNPEDGTVTFFLKLAPKGFTVVFR